MTLQIITWHYEMKLPDARTVGGFTEQYMPGIIAINQAAPSIVQPKVSPKASSITSVRAKAAARKVALEAEMEMFKKTRIV